MRLIFWIVVVLFVVITIDFVMTNGQPVQFGSWFLPWKFGVPSGLAVLLAVALGLLIGGFLAWSAGGKARRRARQAERKVGALERELNALLQRVEGVERDAIAVALPEPDKPTPPEPSPKPPAAPAASETPPAAGRA